MNNVLKNSSLDIFFSKIRSENKKIVFTNGCFDIIHPGHIHVLSHAKLFGDILVVGLNSDKSVKNLKGKERPLVNESDRAKILLSIKYVDYVTIFDESTPKDIIEKIKPDTLVKGGDYIVDDIVGSKFVIDSGGRVEIVKFLDGYSSSNYIDNLN
jgi:D-beta-D-heptose 7-phosphate kinase/D-beta-D-heptose 1-phosphate adenosyltransferase